MDNQQAEKDYEAKIESGEVTLLYGLWLEGADWDPEEQLLKE